MILCIRFVDTELLTTSLGGSPGPDRRYRRYGFVTNVGYGTLLVDHAHNYRIPLPPSLERVTDPRELSITVTWFTTSVVAFAAIALGLLYGVLHQTGIGVRIRAVSQDREAARMTGRSIDELLGQSLLDVLPDDEDTAPDDLLMDESLKIDIERALSLLHPLMEITCQHDLFRHRRPKRLLRRTTRAQRAASRRP